MIRRWFAILASVICVGACLPTGAQDAPAPEDSPLTIPELTRHVFDNGLALYHAHIPAETAFTIDCTVWGGWNEDPEDRDGLGHVLEHLLFEQKDYPEQEFGKQVEAKGGSYGGWVSQHYWTYRVDLPERELGFGADWLGQVLWHESLQLGRLQQVKDIIYVEEGWDGSEWTDNLDPVMDYVLYPLRHEKSFWEDTFGVDFRVSRATSSITRGLTSDEVNAHYRTYYVPSNTVAIYAGPHPFDDVVAALAPRFGGAPAADGPHLRSYRPTKSPEAAFDAAPSPVDNRVAVGYLFDGPLTEEPAFLSLYGNVLRDHLQDELRYRRHQTYSVNLRTIVIHGGGFMKLSFATRNDNLLENYALTDRVVRGDLESVLSEEDFTSCRDRWLLSIFAEPDRDSVSSLVDWAVWCHPDHSPGDDILQQYAAAGEMDYTTFLRRSGDLRTQAAPYTSIKAGTWRETLLLLLLMALGMLLCFYRVARYHRKRTPKTVLFKTGTGAMVKIVYGCGLVFGAVYGLIWLAFGFDCLASAAGSGAETGAIGVYSPANESVFAAIALLVVAMLFSGLWLLLGNLPPSRLIASEDGLHIRTMGWRRVRIPYDSITEMSVRQGLLAGLVNAVKTATLVRREFMFAFTLKTIELRTKRSRRVIGLEIADADELIAIIRERAGLPDDATEGGSEAASESVNPTEAPQGESAAPGPALNE